MDPKGLRAGADEGWWDYKVVATLFMPHVLERQIAASRQALEIAGQPWTFRVRGVLLSNTESDLLASQGKFRIKTSAGVSVQPNPQDFAERRIIFQPVTSAATTPDHRYIEDVLTKLVEDTELDRRMAYCAEIQESPGSNQGQRDNDQWSQTFIESHRGQPITDIIGDVIRDYIRG